MARSRKTTTTESVDWYLISVDRLRQIGTIVLVLLIGVAAWFYIQRQRADPRSNAEGAISDARQALNALAKSKDFPAHHGDFERAQKKLDEAAAMLSGGRYGEAQTAAVESQTISRSALSGTDEENDARFLTVEGDVQFQKSSSSDWKRADLRAPLVNGDWVKTGDGASAELMFQNGSLYTIGPNALLEIYSTALPGSTKKTNSVQMQVGSVEVATVNAGSTVRTPGTQVVVDSESTTQVGIDKDKATSIVTMRGSAAVASSAGGEGVKLAAGDKVVASNAGALSSVEKLLLPPALSNPADNQVFSMTSERRVAFEWAPQKGASAYQLQVSRSRLFSTIEIDSRRTKTTADARVSSEGTFYWRVASVSANGETGPFSPFRRFRVMGGSRSAVTPGDTEPPPLTLKTPFNIGGQFYIIEGTTEPGATVFINDEEVDVESSGHFKKLVSFGRIGQNAVVVKAVDPSGNQTVQSQTVMVEE